MRTLLLTVLAFHTGLSFAGESTDANEPWLREGLSAQIGKFQRITMTPHPEHKGITAANCETDPSWWSTARVLHHTGDKIDWVAAFPKEYTENRGHYIPSCNWRHLQNLDMWMLEIFDSTHMGNGSLWLFALDGHDLRLLLHTEARGRHLKPQQELDIPSIAETRLIEDHLRADYRTSSDNSTKAESIFLSGTLATFDQEGKELSRTSYTSIWQ